MATKTNTEINGNKYYRIRRTIDGTVKAFYGASKGDAEKQYREFLEDHTRKKYRQQELISTATLHERAEEYIENVLTATGRYAEGTKDRYRGAYNTHINGTPLDKTVLSKIRPSDIQKFYNNLDVSMSTLKAVHKFLTAFCKWAQRNEYTRDFMSAVEIPKKVENKQHDGIVVWSDEEIAAILDYIDGCQRLSTRRRLDFMVLVLLYTGARISEALSLRYTDIKDGIVHIERQCYRSEIKAPKWNSVRSIPQHEALVEALKKHRKWHLDDMKKHGYKTDYIFTTSSGNLYSASSVRKTLVRMCEKIGIGYKHIHAYRATFCTQMCRCGVPMEVTSKLMGHKNLETTAAHYRLIQRDTMQDAIAKLTYKTES